MTDEQLKAMASEAARRVHANEGPANPVEAVLMAQPEWANNTPAERAAILAVGMVRAARGDIAEASLCGANAARIMLRERQNW